MIWFFNGIPMFRWWLMRTSSCLSWLWWRITLLIVLRCILLVFVWDISFFYFNTKMGSLEVLWPLILEQASKKLATLKETFHVAQCLLANFGLFFLDFSIGFSRQLHVFGGSVPAKTPPGILPISHLHPYLPDCNHVRKFFWKVLVLETV